MQPIKTKAAGPSSVWDGGPEPDVTWGHGGIDDWGWTAHEPEPSIDAPSTRRPTRPIPPKELIQHV
jgi:hypothetical protein